MEPKNSTKSLSTTAIDHIKQICSEYGLYGNIIHYTPSPIPESDRNKYYIVAGTDPAIVGDSLPEYYFPEDVLRRQERNSSLFYPNAWVFDLSEDDNRMSATEQLVEYCKSVEFLRTIYGEYGLNLPEKIRISEINQLLNFYSSANNPLLDDRTRKKCRKDLDWFFKRERSTGIRKKWLDYFRSEKFPDDKGPIGRISGFVFRNRQHLSIRQMMDANCELHKLEMEEHEYKLFVKFMKEVYPEVSYYAGPKEVVNNGIGNPKETEDVFGRRITGEEYAVIRKERFADEGWDALKNLKPAYWEFRDVYYKACDEPLIAAAYNSITLIFAKCDPLNDLVSISKQSPLRLIDIPQGQEFMNFVSLAKANQLRFYIDNIGQFATPSLDKVRVIYNEHQGEKLKGILERMVVDKISFSHMYNLPEHTQALSDVIQGVEKLQDLSHQKRLNAFGHKRELKKGR